MGKRRAAYRVLVWKPERKNHLEEPDIDWIDLAWDRDRCGHL